MLDLIRIAYAVEPERVSGGPSWLELDRFDVFAKAPETSAAETRRVMLQSLLAERFQLAIHNDNRPIPAFGLTVKDPHLKEASGEGDSGCKVSLENASNGARAGGGPVQLQNWVYGCRNMSMSSFAQALLYAPGVDGYLNNRPVVDHTGLKGSYDFTLRYTPKVPAGIAATGEQIPLFDGLEKQLGLKLESTAAPMPTIVVDSVNRKPTENSAEAMKSFSPLPAIFEVASLKQSAPNAPPAHEDIKNGRLYLPGISLQNLIMAAWGLNGSEFLAGAPKWLNEDRYDILAKAPEGVAMIGDVTPIRNGVSVNMDAFLPMLRALIMERFQLIVHTEERPMNAYTLVANKPRLKKADPTSRTKCDKSANPSLAWLVTCQNMTMAQFAEMLPNIAIGYLGTNVVDGTGLEGGYDFTFSFSPIDALEAAQTARSPGIESTTEAPDPSAAISLFDALNRQLGLKLERVKRPVPVLVIDKVERKPLEN